MIDKHSTVRLNFALRLSDGGVIDSNLEQAPCEFRYGDGRLLPGFEQSLLGMSAGERAVITLPPEQAFGVWQDERQLEFAKHRFADYDLQPGLVISFADPSGERPGVVKRVQQDTVVVDFNHPLAGKAIDFEVHIHAVSHGQAEEPK